MLLFFIKHKALLTLWKDRSLGTESIFFLYTCIQNEETQAADQHSQSQACKELIAVVPG